jgi:hypothetical protein
MQVYEIVVDGELSAALADSLGPIRRKDVGGATVLSVTMDAPDALARVLALLETLGIGVTAVHQVGEAGPRHGPDG